MWNKPLARDHAYVSYAFNCFYLGASCIGTKSRMEKYAKIITVEKKLSHIYLYTMALCSLRGIKLSLTFLSMLRTEERSEEDVKKDNF